MSVDQLSQGRKEELAEVSNTAKTPQGPIQVRNWLISVLFTLQQH
jgi:hypothetical protein